MLLSLVVYSSTFRKIISLYYKGDNSVRTLDWPTPSYSSLYPKHLSQGLTHNRYQTNGSREVGKHSPALNTAPSASLQALLVLNAWDQSCPQ